MKLTAEFTAAKNKIDHKEKLIETLLDATIVHKKEHLGTPSDIFFEKHMQEIGEMFLSISNRLDYMYTLPVSKVSKSYLQMHVKDINNLVPSIVERLDCLEEQISKGVIEDTHQKTITNTLVALGALLDGHKKLVADFVHMVKDQRGDNKPPNP